VQTHCLREGIPIEVRGSSGLVGMREKWVLVFRDSYQQLAKNRCQYKSQDGDGYGRENGPKKEGVPLPQPDAAS